MHIVDFTEIPDGHSFEIFVYEYLQAHGLQVSYPSVGVDGGKDMIASASVQFGATFNWLVSCKHFAGTGRNVGTHLESADKDKLLRFGCHGFMFVFSTEPVSGFSQKMDDIKLRSGIQYCILGKAFIENELILNVNFRNILYRFFPNSFNKLTNLLNAKPLCEDTVSYFGHDNGRVLIHTKNGHGVLEDYLYCSRCADEFTAYLSEQNDAYAFTVIKYSSYNF